MSSSVSRSDDDLDPIYELALRIALERSKVETQGSSGSAAWPLPRRRSLDTGTGPSRSVRNSDRRPTQSAPSRRPLPPPAAAPPCGERWVLVPAPSARTRTPEIEARAAHRELQRQSKK
ncbi:hypothetical protein D1007_57374 [Hordeum vulgare]|nr:hypothetical protein D1007_57374 [Hordeum vulgare]